MIEYGLTVLALGDYPFVPITGDRFRGLKEAQRKLATALAIEEKLTLVLENYVEFEQELLTKTIDHLVFNPENWSAGMAHLYAVSRRLLNLLTLGRLYLDQVTHDIGFLYGSNSELKDLIQQKKSSIYDDSLGFRAMEALRNYTQHRGLPVHNIEHSGMWRDEDARGFATNIMTPYLRTSKLRVDGGFKAAVLSELEALGDKIDIKPLVREYVSGIGAVHEYIRQQIADDVSEWDQLIQGAVDEYKATGQEKTIGLFAVEQSPEITDKVAISDQLTSRRKWLRLRTPNLQHFEKHVVTSASKMQLAPLPGNHMSDD